MVFTCFMMNNCLSSRILMARSSLDPTSPTRWRSKRFNFKGTSISMTWTQFQKMISLILREIPFKCLKEAYKSEELSVKVWFWTTSQPPPSLIWIKMMTFPLSKILGSPASMDHSKDKVYLNRPNRQVPWRRWIFWKPVSNLALAQTYKWKKL